MTASRPAAAAVRNVVLSDGFDRHPTDTRARDRPARDERDHCGPGLSPTLEHGRGLVGRSSHDHRGDGVVPCRCRGGQLCALRPATRHRGNRVVAARHTAHRCRRRHRARTGHPDPAELAARCCSRLRQRRRSQPLAQRRAVHCCSRPHRCHNRFVCATRRVLVVERDQQPWFRVRQHRHLDGPRPAVSAPCSSIFHPLLVVAIGLAGATAVAAIRRRSCPPRSICGCGWLPVSPRGQRAEILRSLLVAGSASGRAPGRTRRVTVDRSCQEAGARRVRSSGDGGLGAAVRAGVVPRQAEPQCPRGVRALSHDAEGSVCSSGARIRRFWSPPTDSPPARWCTPTSCSVAPGVATIRARP